MAKLYPPTIDNCVMFKTHIEIPFKHNISVSSDVSLGYALRIKTISSNKEIFNSKAGIEKNNKIYFNVESSKDKFQYGEYYKIQVAYIRDNTPGYYSTFAIARCTSQISSYAFYKDNLIPNKFHLTIDRGTLDKDDVLYTYKVWLCKLNSDYDSFNGFSDTEIQRNFVESAKSSNFKNSYSIISETNTQVIGKSTANVSFNFKDINFDLSKKFQYFLIAKITTANGLSLKTAPVLIPLITNINDLANELTVETNFEYGYALLKNNSGQKVYLSKKSENGYQPLAVLKEDGTYYDFCVEQGQIYTYALGKNKYILNDLDLSQDDAITVENNKGIKNVRIDYEDMSLWDGKNILRLKYNPQVSSFKTTRPEQKVETLGSQYPFVFYNNKVGYKEFPISAFIATEMDNNNDIINEYKLMEINKFNKIREQTESSDEIFYGHGQISKDEEVYTRSGASGPLFSSDDKKLTLPGLKDSFIDIAEEFKEERLFKNKIMNWLNNGEPKLFRSPQEGMFIVQIMGVSMSPNDQLARKMHTVQMNAVEIAEYTYENLIKYGIIKEPSSSSKGENLYTGFMDFSSYSSFKTLE